MMAGWRSERGDAAAGEVGTVGFVEVVSRFADREQAVIDVIGRGQRRFLWG